MLTEDHPPKDAPVPGIYKHYKGPEYRVLGMARHSETEEWMVVYQALYGSRGYWLRPLVLWLEPVNSPTEVDSSEQKKPAHTIRFQLMEESELSLTQLTD